MAEKRKRPKPTDSSENMSSGESRGAARSWTADEMASAQPLPLPTVDQTATVPLSGVPYAGKGQTKPAGRPENDEEAGV